MAEPFEDWEEADVTEINAPVIGHKPVAENRARVTAPTESSNSGRTVQILKRRDHGPSAAVVGPERREPVPRVMDSQKLHEHNMALWDKANSYVQPIINRSDNNTRTEYVPEIRILRRPKTPVTGATKTSTVTKPLAQREADYYAAREKIFGPSSSSTSPGPSSASQSPSARSSATASRSDSPSQENPVKPIQFDGRPPRTMQRHSSGGSSSSSTTDSLPIRQPLGPSATGFANSSSSSSGFRARPGSNASPRTATASSSEGSVGFQRSLAQPRPRPA